LVLQIAIANLRLLCDNIHILPLGGNIYDIQNGTQ